MRSFLSFFSRRRMFGVVISALMLGLAASWGSLAAADEISDLRQGVPTGEEVREQIAELSIQRDDLLTALNTVERDLTAVLSARADLDEGQRRLAEQIEAAADHLQTVAVRAFVSGGSGGRLAMLLDVSEASDLSWRRHLLRNHADSSDTALQRLRELESQASEEVRQSIDEAARLRAAIASLEIEVTAVEPLIAEARSLQPLADAWDRAAIAIEEGSYGVASSEKWEKLRFCESTNNYQAISPTGTFRGAYQFNYATWQTVGGTGDPAAAPPAEQDARARELYARRGPQPWECGYHLE